MAELFEMFCEDVKDEVAKLSGYNVEIQEVTKNNGVNMKGLCLINEEKYKPIVYLRPIFDNDFIIEKKSINEIAKKINDFFLDAMKEVQTYDVDETYTNWKDNIFISVINYDANKESLENIPHIRFLDLAVIFRLLIYINDEGMASTIMQDLADNMNLDEIFEIAKKNTLRMFDKKYINMYEYLRDKGWILPIGLDKDAIYVLTNKYNILGSSFIIMPEIFESICEERGIDGCYIIPSSTDQIILLFENSDSQLEVKLKENIRQVNDQEVSDSEILSYNLYRFDIRTDAVRIVE